MSAWIVPLPYGAQLVIETNIEHVVEYLKKRGQPMSDLTPLLKDIAKLMREGLGRRFADAGAGTWAELAASTRAAKTMAGLPPLTPKGRIPRRLKQNGEFGAANILIATGALRDAYRQKGAKGHIERIDAKAGTVEVGAKIILPSGYDLAAIHQFGTKPYIIVAKMAKSLAFPGSKGATIFRHSVHHPGLKARPVFLTPEEQDQIRKTVQDYLSNPS